MTDQKRETVEIMCEVRFCRSVVPTGWQVCPCRPAATRLSVPAADDHLSRRITELVLERRHFDHRRIWQLLRQEVFTSITSGIPHLPP